VSNINFHTPSISTAIIFDKIRRPDLISDLIQWLDGTWHGATLPNIDELKTAKANKLDLEVGSKTFDRVARETNGSSGARNRAKLVRELKELPIMPWMKTTTV